MCEERLGNFEFYVLKVIENASQIYKNKKQIVLTKKKKPKLIKL